MSTSLTLANCYTPLVLPDYTIPAAQDTTIARCNGDGKSRTALQLRRLFLEINISPTALGSSLVELGHSKVLCHVVHGDVNLASVEEAVVDVKVEWAAHFGFLAMPQVAGLDQHLGNIRTSNNNNKSGMAVEYATKIKEAVLPAMVSLHNLPKTVVSIQLTILQDDGSILSACIMAASLALSNASLELFDLVTSCTVCCSKEGEILVDPTMKELEESSGSLTLSMLYAWKEVTLWQQTGTMINSKAMELAKEACRTLSKFMRECLVQQS